MQGLWESALSTLEGRIKPHNFEMWLRPINCQSIDGQRILLSAPSKWIKEWFQDNYQQIVLDAIRDQTQKEYEIIFQVQEPDREPAPSRGRRAGSGRNRDGEVQSRTPPTCSTSTTSELRRRPVEPARAHAASRAVAEVPAENTTRSSSMAASAWARPHLVHAIGHRIRETPPGLADSVSQDRSVHERVHQLRSQREDRRVPSEIP